MTHFQLTEDRKKVIASYVELLLEPHSIEKYINLSGLLLENTWLPITSEVAIALLVSRRFIDNDVLIGKVKDRLNGINRRL